MAKPQSKTPAVLPPTKTAKVSQPPEPKQTPLQQFLSRLKTHRQTQVISVSFLVAFLALVAAVSLVIRTQSIVQFNQPEVVLPSPSPRVETRFANDPTVLEIDTAVASISAELKTLQIKNHLLLPPTLDTDVNLDL